MRPPLLDGGRRLQLNRSLPLPHAFRLLMRVSSSSSNATECRVTGVEVSLLNVHTELRLVI